MTHVLARSLLENYFWIIVCHEHTNSDGGVELCGGHCQVNRCEDVCGQSEGDSEPSRCSMDAGFLSPSPEGLRANASIAGCGHEMAPRPEVTVDHRMRRQKPLCLAG